MSRIRDRRDRQKKSSKVALQSLTLYYRLSKKTYNSRDSPMVTHSNTNLPVRSLCTGERTGPAAFSDLWSYVAEIRVIEIINGSCEIVCPRSNIKDHGSLREALPTPSALDFLFSSV